jgi:HD-like signal output (HDOD) protein
MDMKMFWRASLATAGYAAWLAKSAGYREDIAFTGGMMLHVGVLLLHMEEPEKTQAIDKAVAIGGFRPELETPVFGFHHVDVSAELATRWNFPPEIIGGMRSYTDPLSQASSEPYGAIYRIADFLAEALLRETSEEQISAEFPKDLALALDLNLEPLLSSIPPLKTILEGLEELIG